MATSDVELIAAAVEEYLAAHPDGADNVDGIAGWWLPALGVVATIEDTEAALELLVQRGLVRRQCSADGCEIYARREKSSDPVSR
jgi:hypothetical protein